MFNFSLTPTSKPSAIRYALLAATMTFVFSQPLYAQGYISIPDRAMAFLRVDVEALRYTSEFSVLERLLGHVDTEASIASVAKLGIDVTTLRDITLMTPAFENVINAGEPPLCANVRFNKSFRTTQVRKHLDESWKESTVDGKTIFVNADSTCLYLASNKTLLLGTQSAVSWFITHENTEDSYLTDICLDSLGEAHISFGADLRDVPSELIQTVLPKSQLSFKPGYLAIDITLDDELILDGYMYCDNSQEAHEATGLMESFVQKGINSLVELESQQAMSAQNTSQAAEDLITQLGLIAVIREAIETLEAVETEEEDTIACLRANVNKGYCYTAGVLVPAVTALGGSTQSAFTEVASELAPTPAEPQPTPEVSAEREERPANRLIDAFRSGSSLRRPGVR